MFREKTVAMPVIDLTGPEGNAFILMGYAKKWAKQLDRPFEPLQKEMMGGDYENLLAVSANQMEK